MGTIGTLVNKSPTLLRYKPATELMLGSAYIGVEIEAENVPRDITLPVSLSCYWSAHADESLRNNGMEFTFTIPLFGEDAVSAIRGLCSYARDKKWAISQRTGLHVHLDVRDMEVDDLCKLLCLYSLAEPALYKWIGDAREFNHFCLPWYTAQHGLNKAAQALMMPSREARMLLQEVQRYSGLNLQALAKFGSIEFRQMKTTFDPDRIFTWINFIMALKAHAISTKYSLDDIAEEATTGREFLDNVFGTTYAAKLWYPKYDKDIVEYGITSVEELLKGFKGGTVSSAAATFHSAYTLAKKEAGTPPGLDVFKTKYLSKSYSKVMGTPAELWATLDNPIVQDAPQLARGRILRQITPANFDVQDDSEEIPDEDSEYDGDDRNEDIDDDTNDEGDF
jgi:hypothetical protein